MHREGTKNYYYFDPDIEVMNKLIDMRNHAKKYRTNTRQE